LQRAAARRLERLLECLKRDGGLGQRSDDGAGGGRGGGGAGGGGRRDESITPIAQLKALRALQQEINDRTRAFDKEHPDRAKLTKREEDDLQAIRQEQGEIADLFQQLSAPAESQEDKK
jgi:hypothetical protein